jgi:hypothetical protein
VVADACSRKEEDTKSLLCVICVMKSNRVEEKRIEWNKD